jgi:hypothetical protein
VIAELLFAGVALVAVSTFAGIAISALRGKGASDVRAAELGKDLEVSRANEKTQSARADAEKERADALDAAIAKSLAAAVGDIDGAFKRLQEAMDADRTRTSGRSGAALVRDAGAGEAPTGTGHRESDSDLLEPGA